MQCRKGRDDNVYVFVSVYVCVTNRYIVQKCFVLYYTRRGPTAVGEDDIQLIHFLLFYFWQILKA